RPAPRRGADSGDPSRPSSRPVARPGGVPAGRGLTPDPATPMSPDPLTLNPFDGVARLFPLPNVVLFPRVVQPLHIFDPRYRQMTAHALASDRYLALALLKPGWAAAYQAKPAIHPVVCLPP